MEYATGTKTTEETLSNRSEGEKREKREKREKEREKRERETFSLTANGPKVHIILVRRQKTETHTRASESGAGSRGHTKSHIRHTRERDSQKARRERPTAFFLRTRQTKIF